ncbi:hypothetical protein HNY73_007169 [Argiope bruennichi]|uniref:DDE-1 domain-containing protein n=1 Tax=Argiope bruennichi TaxID=94029 RepID=A0A8T0FE50_ARGBR|nr:hypothetical protein HNY73_007169 [Argiope bruennichi]
MELMRSKETQRKSHSKISMYKDLVSTSHVFLHIVCHVKRIASDLAELDEKISTALINAEPEDFDSEYEKWEEYREKLDETHSRNSPVFVQISSGTTYMKSATQGKTMFSVLFGISASGNYMPHFAIYKGAHLYESWTKGGPPGALYACTESGWMQDSFSSDECIVKFMKRCMANKFIFLKVADIAKVNVADIVGVLS